MWTPQVPWPVLWAVLQLGWRPGWLLDAPNRSLSFSPSRLTVSEGASATFTCSLASMSEDFVLNWYRMSPSNQTYKLAAFPRDHRQDPRFQVTKLPNGHDFSMRIMATQRNDSGIYLCGAISLPPTAQITESPPAELTVTERDVESPTSHPSPSPRPGGQFQNLVVVVTSVLVGVPVLLLLAWVLTTVRPTATQGVFLCRGQRSPKCRPNPGEPWALYCEICPRPPSGGARCMACRAATWRPLNSNFQPGLCLLGPQAA
ncbi:programmed cell death protein 1 isoform X2 [Nycticebus coucang]|uniref:programmed cell death protein 1 isoform X2 n=1 Tax=Nycticebus coucang TaxID=9470 RepID=UPI00234C3D08|nr:programmed cell death protein 1 isoform X2 [Nycticebus coucang]